MKTKTFFCSLFIYLSMNAAASGLKVKQDSLDLPGDNLDLYAVMDLFKKSENPEEFEKALNKEDNKINNLDLNGDNETDYIKVVDHSGTNAHALVLQVDVNEKETQDIAVIEIEKKDNETANLQIIGDEELYGKNYIIEPAEENAAKAPASNENKTTTNVVVNVWGWPMVPHIYRPTYVVWVSPWHWKAYPVWWKPWRPVYYSVYHPHWHPYHSHHHRVYVHRTVVAHNIYYGHRKVSKTVVHKRGPSKQVNAPRKSGKSPGVEKKRGGNQGKNQQGGRQKQGGKSGKRK